MPRYIASSDSESGSFVFVSNILLLVEEAIWRLSQAVLLELETFYPIGRAVDWYSSEGRRAHVR